MIFKSILVFDPGESTGWVFLSAGGEISGGTCGREHRQVADLITNWAPDVIVVERFNLYPGMAKSMSWNSFYPCEVIGVIRYFADVTRTKYVEQAPSVKKYAGGLGDDWEYLKQKCFVTEHTKDAYLHLKYFLRNTKRPE